jgi:tRNA(Ile)-lysidine synthase
VPTPNVPPEALDPAPNAGLVARFRADLEALTGRTGKVLLAVSGGPDSVAMLLLAHHAVPDRILAATVDHGLRAESASEAAHVRDLCARLGVGHTTVRVKVRTRGNVPDAARIARYAALNALAEQQGADWIATAHHADDQLETLLMRLNRGSGLGGLAGIRRRNNRVVRPLLGWTRRELGDVVVAAGIDAVDDPSNRDDRYDRARLRKMLANADWLDPQGASRSAAHIDEAAKALDWVAAGIRPEAQAMADLPDEIARRVVLNGIMAANPGAAPDPGQLARALAALRAGRRTMLAAVVCTPGDPWTFERAPPRRAGVTRPPEAA